MKFRPYSRRQHNKISHAWLRANAWLLGIASGVVLAIVGGVTIALAHALPATRMSGYFLGAFAAAVLVSWGFGVYILILATDREAIWHVRGAWGEENTRSELVRARRKRLIWGWVDSVQLERGDIDHLVVTRAGGLVAIDSKWRSEASAAEIDAMVRSAKLGQLRAEAVLRSVTSIERGAHRSKVNPLPVRSVVVLWGAAQHAVPDDVVLNDIRFLRGRQLVNWLRSLDGDRVDRRTGKDLVARIASFRNEAWSATEPGR